jgi:Flp pilus assembly protein TadD
MEQADIYARIGQSYTAQGDNQKALDTLKKARQLVPNSVPIVSQIAQLLDSTGKQSEALAAYRDAMKVDSNNGLVLNNLAYLMCDTNGNLDDALSLAQRAKQQLPGYDEVSDTIGWIYIKKGLSDSAIAVFKDLNNKVKDNPTFHYHYAVALAQKKDKAAALKEVNRAMELNKDLEAKNQANKKEEDQINELVRKLR